LPGHTLFALFEQTHVCCEMMFAHQHCPPVTQHNAPNVSAGVLHCETTDGLSVKAH
jgi:hypothetical protein